MVNHHEKAPFGEYVDHSFQPPKIRKSKKMVLFLVVFNEGNLLHPFVLRFSITRKFGCFLSIWIFCFLPG